MNLKKQLTRRRQLGKGTTGLNLLKQHLHRISMIDNPTCDYGTDRETPEHNKFHSQNNAVLIDILIDTIELSFVASQTPIPDRVINLKTILGYNSHLPPEAQSYITAAVNSFVGCTDDPLIRQQQQVLHVAVVHYMLRFLRD